jgi:hypothetical protein
MQISGANWADELRKFGSWRKTSMEMGITDLGNVTNPKCSDL